MITRNIIPVSQARKNIFKLLKDIQMPGKYYGITEKGELKGYLISSSELESIIETLEVMMEFPNLEKDVKDVKKAIKNGSYKKWPTLESMLLKKKNKYGLSNNLKTKRAKRTKKIRK